MPGSFVFFVILMAWTSTGLPTKDSGVRAFWTLDECHDHALEFARRRDTPIRACTKISKEGYDIIAAYTITFDNDSSKQYVIVENYETMEIARLRKALREIGKWHRGKTKDSQRVRAIIRKVLP